MMIKNCFVLICCSIFSAVSFELRSNYSYGFDFRYKPTSDGKLDVTYNCSQHLQEVNKTANWGEDHLPDEMESLTIQNCNLNLSIGWDYDVRENKEWLDHRSGDKFPFFEQLVFKNITTLTVGPLIAGFQFYTQGNITISIEDVQMKVLRRDFLTSTVIKKKFPPGDVGSLRFVMKNVHIEEIQSNAFFWELDDIPLTLEFNNVTFNNISSEAIKLQDYNNNTHQLNNIQSHPENQIFIMNSTFNTLPKEFIKGEAKDFYFKNNKVKIIETNAINIKAKNIEISNNELNYIKNFSFARISRGENSTFNFNSNKINASEKCSLHLRVCDQADIEESTSFHNNEFKCINSAWLQRDKHEKEKVLHSCESKETYLSDVKQCEKFLFSGIKNVCTDSEIKCLKSIKNFRHDYKYFGRKWNMYCIAFNSIENTTFFIIFIISIIFGLGMSGFIYNYTKGAFSQGPFVKKRYDNKPQILITVAS